MCVDLISCDSLLHIVHGAHEESIDIFMLIHIISKSGNAWGMTNAVNYEERLWNFKQFIHCTVIVSLICTDLWFITDRINCITLFLAPLASEVSNLFGELSAVLRDADVFEDLLYAEGCESPLAKQTLQQVPRGIQLQVEYPSKSYLKSRSSNSNMC